MKNRLAWLIVGMGASFSSVTNGYAQISEICGETGRTPWLSSPFVFGKVLLTGFEDSPRFPKVTVSLIDRQQIENRITIDRSGNYCFRDINGSGGSLVIQVEGAEVARRSLSSSGPPQFREDFEIFFSNPEKRARPGTVSVKYAHPRDDKNTELMKKAEAADGEGTPTKAIGFLKQILATDPTDFIAWAKLGSIHFAQNKFADAEAGFRRSLEAKADYTPAMLNLGRTLLVQNKADEAVPFLQKATTTEPVSARAYQLLGEAYLLAKKGTLGVQALNEAIRLDPIGMAECHLLIARLYDRAGVKSLASGEYRLFLSKIPTHPDKKKFERYIKDNPEGKVTN